MDIHKFYDSTFDQFLKFMKPNELEELIHDMGMRVFNNDSIDTKLRTSVLWTRSSNLVSSYDIYPGDLTFSEQRNAERFIDILNRMLETHPGYIELNEFYEAYNSQIQSMEDCLVVGDGVLVSKIVTNPVDTVVGFLLDKDIRIDKVNPTEGVTRSDLGTPVIRKTYSDKKYHITFDTPVDISKAKVAYINLMKLEGDSKKKSKK